MGGEPEKVGILTEKGGSFPVPETGISIIVIEAKSSREEIAGFVGRESEEYNGPRRFRR